ncbi:hypothetical protein FA95DRAFT_1034935 [Auriscalpium vulgare]|uniref:Uncharacterized protein n=1 Tax=Auriscalpium vulgare TaxID=40419 RepID=A0ACB8RWX5_9AGAM|nr:hypothetical protein FA95DRAFT_1034935 [Auriscalpium vulgare]
MAALRPTSPSHDRLPPRFHPAFPPSIQSLCPELLAEVFAILVIIEPASGTWNYDPDAGEERTIGWIKVTHVCHRWRATALEFSGLWSFIAFPLGDSCATKMVERAGSAPLQIYPHTIPDDPEDELTPIQLAIISKHLHHTESLALLLANESADELIGNMVAPAPMLESLQLTREASPGIPLPAMLFGGSAPRLRSLDVIGFTAFPWTSNIFSGLEYLSVDMTLWGVEANETYCETMLDAFEGMLVLKHLTLAGCFPAQHRHNHGQRTVRLARLKDFEATAIDTSECMHVVKHLDIPFSSAFRVLVSHHDDDDEEDLAAGFTPIVPFVASTLAPSGSVSSNNRITTLLIKTNHRAPYHLDLYACHRHAGDCRIDGPWCPESNRHGAFTLDHNDDIDTTAGFRHILNLTRDIWAYIPWWSLERLQVDVWAEDGVEVGLSWAGLRNAAHLEKIILHGLSALSFCEFVAARDSERLLLPALTELKLRDIDLHLASQEAWVDILSQLPRWTKAGVCRGYPQLSVEF